MAKAPSESGLTHYLLIRVFADKPLKIASVITLFGGIAIILNPLLWEVFNGPLPGYQWILLPGNLSLAYCWYPLFTRELAFQWLWPLHLIGQFLISYSVALIFCKALTLLASRKLRHNPSRMK